MTRTTPPRKFICCLMGIALSVVVCLSGCQTCGWWGGSCDKCEENCGESGSNCGGWRDSCSSWWHRNAGLSVPETLPLGSIVRAHYHTMQTNAEAADFIMHDLDFTGSTAALTPAGRDRIMEIAARARSAPFPVIVERCCNNSNPELDAHRRSIVVQILTDFGIPEANQRVVVAPAYGMGITSMEAEMDFYQNTWSRGNGGGGGRNRGGGGFNGGGGGFGGGGGGGGFGGGVF